MSSSLTCGPVGVGGVDEVDAELDRAAQDRLRLVAVGGRAPDAGAGDPHRAEAEAVDGQVAADTDRAGRTGWYPGFDSDMDHHSFVSRSYQRF